MIDFSRYERNILVPEIAEKGQEKLNNASVLVIGAGGLGSPVLYYLVAAGVEKITIIDGDVVNISNLQRQIIHTENDLGKNKALSAKEKLIKLNSGVRVDIFENYLDNDNILDFFELKFDLIFDCTDNFAARKIINKLSLMSKTPFVYAAISGFSGQLTLFDPNNIDITGCYNCLFNDLSDNKEPIPVASTTPGIIGAMAACEGLKYLLDIPNENTGKLILTDTLSLTVKKVALSRNMDCTEC